jgi:hypothetical protein
VETIVRLRYLDADELTRYKKLSERAAVAHKRLYDFMRTLSPVMGKEERMPHNEFVRTGDGRIAILLTTYGEKE